MRRPLCFLFAVHFIAQLGMMPLPSQAFTPEDVEEIKRKLYNCPQGGSGTTILCLAPVGSSPRPHYQSNRDANGRRLQPYWEVYELETIRQGFYPQYTLFTQRAQALDPRPPENRQTGNYYVTFAKYTVEVWESPTEKKDITFVANCQPSINFGSGISSSVNSQYGVGVQTVRKLVKQGNNWITVEAKTLNERPRTPSQQEHYHRIMGCYAAYDFPYFLDILENSRKRSDSYSNY